MPARTDPRVHDRGDEPNRDARVRRSRTAVLAATTELLLERGWSGVSVDEIARRSGVAKTTIYRHWPARCDLMRDACVALATPQVTPDTGNIRDDLIELTRDLARLLKEAEWSSVLPSIADAAERDRDIADMQRMQQKRYVRPFEVVLERAITRGELPEDSDVAVLVAALTGPLFFRRWFSREPLTEDFAREIVRLVLR